MRFSHNPGDIPTPFTLGVGETEYNTFDKKLFTVDDNKECIEIMGNSGDWAAKEGPLTAQSDYVDTWAIGKQFGGSFDAVTYDDRIVIKKDGHYKLEYRQRSGNDVDAYGAVSINGTRENAENNPNGTFAHDHSAQAQVYDYSHYLGYLKAGDYVGGGAKITGTEDVDWQWGAGAYIGNLIIIRLK